MTSLLSKRRGPLASNGASGGLGDRRTSVEKQESPAAAGQGATPPSLSLFGQGDRCGIGMYAQVMRTAVRKSVELQGFGKCGIRAEHSRGVEIDVFPCCRTSR